MAWQNSMATEAKEVGKARFPDGTPQMGPPTDLGGTGADDSMVPVSLSGSEDDAEAVVAEIAGRQENTGTPQGSPMGLGPRSHIGKDG